MKYFDPYVPLAKDTDQIVGPPEKLLTAAHIQEPLPLGAPEAAKSRISWVT